MTTTHLAQKLYDKSRLDADAWRKDLGNWVAISAESDLSYGGSAQDHLWALARDHLKQTIPAYFDCVDEEARHVSPSRLRAESVEQCVGAIVSHARQVRSMAADMHKRLAHLDRAVDLGRWDGFDDKSIVARGDALLRSLGLGTRRSVPSRLNHLVSDHPWFFVAAMSLISLLIGLASFVAGMAVGS